MLGLVGCRWTIVDCGIRSVITVLYGFYITGFCSTAYNTHTMKLHLNPH